MSHKYKTVCFRCGGSLPEEEKTRIVCDSCLAKSADKLRAEPSKSEEKPLPEKEVLTSLCTYDRRNPDNGLEYLDPEDYSQPRTNCSCDNCYYGRDSLALEIIRLRKVERDLANQLLRSASLTITEPCR